MNHLLPLRFKLQEVLCLIVLSLLLVVHGSPSWRSRGTTGHRYAPPLPQLYQMLEDGQDSSEDEDLDTPPAPPRFFTPSEDDETEALQEFDDTAEEMGPQYRLQWEEEPQNYMKRVYPVRFNEARMHKAKGLLDSSPSTSRSSKQPNATTEISSPAHNNKKEEDDNRKEKKQELPANERLWMKKRSRSITLKKREGRLTADEQQKLLGELGNILKDDDRTVKKTPSTNVKRQANISEEESAKLLVPSEHQKFEDWLKQEYLRNMALSFATAKKKKRSASNKGGGHHDELRKKRKVSTATTDDVVVDGGLGQEFFDPETLDAVKDRLKLIENAVLADAIQKIILRARDGAVTDASGSSDRIANRLAEAYYIEKLKQTLDKLPHNWGKFREEEEEDGDDEGQYQWKKRGNGNLAEALTVMAPTDDKRQNFDEEEQEVCPELQLLTSDCSALEDVLPDSPMTSALRHVCNKHEVCYTCGEAFGLTSSDCDGFFLRDTMALCRASGLCHSAGKLLLQPLHERRVFYKRSVPPICYRAPCVEAFLLEQ